MLMYVKWLELELVSTPFFQFFLDIIVLHHCISLGVQHNDLTYTYCEVITAVSLFNTHDLI